MYQRLRRPKYHVMDKIGEVGNNGLVVRRYSIADERGSGLGCSWRQEWQPKCEYVEGLWLKR